MTYDALSSLYRDRLDELMDKRAVLMMQGSAKDYADYRFRVGELAGLRLARDAFREALSTVMKVDDD